MMNSTDKTESETYIHSFEELLDLLKQGHVISFKRWMGDPRTERQVRIDDGNLVLVTIDPFGQRSRPKEIDQEHFKKLYEDWITPSGWCPVGGHFTSHKKRISSRSKNPDIVDEKVAKAELYRHLVEKHPESVIVPEVTFLRRRADFVVINDYDLHVFEIKSEVDNLSRLKKQIEEYKRFSSKVTLVIHSNKLKSIPDDKSLGVMTIDRGRLKHKRAPRDYCLKPAELMKLVWGKERSQMFNGLKGRTKFKEPDHVACYLKAALNKNQQCDYLLSVLKKRFEKEHKQRLNLLLSKGVESAVSMKRKFDFSAPVRTVSIKDFFEKQGLGTLPDLKETIGKDRR